jgi:hypothetical protein
VVKEKLGQIMGVCSALCFPPHLSLPFQNEKEERRDGGRKGTAERHPVSVLVQENLEKLLISQQNSLIHEELDYIR